MMTRLKTQVEANRSLYPTSTKQICKAIFSLTLSWRRPLSYRNQSIVCSANQWTGFYMITASVMKGLKKEFNSIITHHRKPYLAVLTGLVNGRYEIFSYIYWCTYETNFNSCCIFTFGIISKFCKKLFFCGFRHIHWLKKSLMEHFTFRFLCSVL